MPRSNNNNWRVLRIERLHDWVAARHDQGYDMQAQGIIANECFVIVRFNGFLCQRSFHCASPRKFLLTLMKVNFTLNMQLPDPNVAHRFIRDLVEALAKHFGLQILRVLRRRVFRRQVRKRVAARIVLSKSSSHCGLPAELIRSICADWL